MSILATVVGRWPLDARPPGYAAAVTFNTRFRVIFDRDDASIRCHHVGCAPKAEDKIRVVASATMNLCGFNGLVRPPRSRPDSSIRQ